MYEQARRVTRVCILALIAIPALVYSYRYVFGLELYEGDEVEERQCRFCGGRGRDDQLALEMPGHSGRCPACAGRGEVRVILPGPRRPVLYRGLVLDEEKVVGSEESLIRSAKPAKLPKKHPAALADATVTFTSAAGDPITLRTGDNGRFSARLAPGEYTVEVRADRRSTLRENVVVERLVAPIWLEKAHIHEPLVDEAARSKHGMDFRAILGREPESGALIVEPALPRLAP